MSSDTPRSAPIWMFAVLVLLCLIIYTGTLTNGFTKFAGDGEYIVSNDAVKKGLSFSSIAWAFSNNSTGNYHPVTWISHLLDVSLFGMKAWGHHSVNVILHILNAILLFSLMSRMFGGRLWPSFCVAAFFAIHPLNVEVVAQAAQRKDLLSMLFFLLSLHAYHNYTQAPSIRGMAKVGLWFVIALLCKSVVVTLPVLLLLLDYWPLRRMKTVKFFGLLREKAALFAIALVFGLLAVVMLELYARTGPWEAYGFGLRAKNAVVVYTAYLVKGFIPIKLSALYPFPVGGVPMSKIALSGLALLILTFIAYKVRRKAPYFTFGWLWYLVTMLPMLGVLQISQAGMSNKYAYLPFIGLYIGVVWLIASAFSADTSETGQAEGAGWAIVLGAVAMILLTLVSWRQTGAWKNDEALFTRAVSVDPANYAAYNKLGLVYEDKKDLDKARQHYERAVSIYPTYYAAHMNLGELFMSKGLYPEAATAFEQASTSQPTNSKPLVNLANAQMYMNDSSSAEFNYGRAIEINPRDSRAHYNLAMILLSRGEDDVAIQHLTAAVQSDAQNKEAALTLGNKLFEKGRLDEALRAYRVALNADPKNLVARLNTATILQKTSRYQSALDEMRLASKHNPKNARVKTMLGEALAASQLLEQAVEAYREALKLEPGAPDATNNLAYLLATAPNPGIRNGKEAVKLALKVNTLAKFEQPGLLDTLACAYAEAGQYRKATETAAKALKIAQRAKMTELATDISQKLLFFKANRPFHYGEGQFGR